MLDNKFITFLVLYQTKSFTNTAKQLFITQPAVSQQIQALQQELAVKLVEYQHSQLTFTSEGIKLAKLIERISTQTQQGLANITNPEKSQSISFGTTLSFNEMIEPQFIQQLANDYSKINCVIKNTATIVEQLISGEIEFGLIEGNFDRQISQTS
ncbi:LysR family transcriptional regulator [Lentilactobacillus kosonis]|uniref:LysR family transcriptional regulator YeiE n=1 Tax=Lentilactobacillus kosonis TaxID=2810561 RepID=A0A401FME5_9LACO|nr:LysR family transcriptional regulator [Lentilactobacillus kosonis]GAY73552.1 LysR family transcriptional regulator YeiE [Lentilactobacillus kosonis]